MREIKLTQGLVAIVSDEDFELANSFKWYASAQGRMKKFYACRHAIINGRRYKFWMHRLITNCPTDKVVDHIDGDGLNNVRENLRIVDYGTNARYAADRTNSRPRFIPSYHD